MRRHQHAVAVRHLGGFVEHQQIRVGQPAQQQRSVLADDTDPVAGADRELSRGKGNSGHGDTYRELSMRTCPPGDERRGRGPGVTGVSST
jgi:hypothetical protein